MTVGAPKGFKADPAKLQELYERLEKEGLLDALGDSDEERTPSTAFKAPTYATRTQAIVEAAQRILKFYGLCVMEMELDKKEVVSAIELASLSAFASPSGLSAEQLQAARDKGYLMFLATQKK